MAELGCPASGSPVVAVRVISQVCVICGLDWGWRACSRGGGRGALAAPVGLRRDC